MLEPLERFFRRVGCLILLDRAADPAANGHVQRNGTHVKVFSGGAVRSLSDLHTQLHAAAHQPGGGDAMAVDAAAATGSLRTLGTGALQSAVGNHTHAGGGGADISARVTHNVDQSIPNGTVTTLAFNTESFDTDAIHDTVTNNSRLTCKTAGVYAIFGGLRFASNATGRRFALILLNGITNIAVYSSNADAGGQHQMTISHMYKLAVNDYLELQVLQTSGGALNVDTSSDHSPMFGMMKVLG